MMSLRRLSTRWSSDSIYAHSRRVFSAEVASSEPGYITAVACRQVVLSDHSRVFFEMLLLSKKAQTEVIRNRYAGENPTDMFLPDYSPIRTLITCMDQIKDQMVQNFLQLHED